MKQLLCPLNGLRNISEFLYGGEVHQLSDPRDYSAKDWAEHVFFDENRAGLVLEWWCHRPTSYWFIAERNTITDEVVRSFPSSEIFTHRIDFDQRRDRGEHV